MCVTWRHNTFQPVHLPLNNFYFDFLELSLFLGLLLRTMGDFWQMVWQEKVQFIVMLTNLMEEKKKKLNSSKTYGLATSM